MVHHFTHAHAVMTQLKRLSCLVHKFGVLPRISIVWNYLMMVFTRGIVIAGWVLWTVVTVALWHILSHICLQVVA